MICLRKEILHVLNLVKNKGYEIYLVGGFVRDALLKKETNDIDMTTNATPDILKEIFKEYKLNEEFIKFGSIKFEINEFHFEITTFRKEFNYKDYRRPAIIEFADSLNEDLIRRDFTINALCYDGEKLIDLFNGVNDLNNKVLKTIGNPNIRFKEDALRILRAIRFASKLDFKIDNDVEEAINSNYENLKNINFNNLYKELKGIFDSSNFINYLKKYKKIFIDTFKLDDLKIELFKKNMKYEEKEALFFYYSNINLNNKYLLNKDIVFINDKIELKKKLKKYGYENVSNCLYFKSTYLNDNKDVYTLLNEIEDNKECYNLKTLKIKGDDLLALNIKGDKIGRHLDMLVDAVIENKCLNNKKDLIKYLKNNLIE